MTYTSSIFPDGSSEPGARIVAGPANPLPNAETFLDARYGHRQRPLLVCHGGAFHHWDGRCWPDVEQAALRAALYEEFRDATYVTGDGDEKPFQPNRRTIGDLIDALAAAALLPRSVQAPAWLDGTGEVPAAEVVAVANGLLHIPTRRLLEHTPTFYAHHAVPFAYDPAAASPQRWLDFLAQLWPDDAEAIDCLAEIFGYLISGDTSLQKMFLLIGPRRSGKGTIARVLTGLLGGHNVAGPTLAGLATNFGLQPLIGKPVALVSDARIGGAQSIITERLLSISGEDLLTVDRKYAAPWTGRIGARFVILSNELPRLTDTSGALASRFVTLTMTNTFYGREDPALTGKLLAELPGILNWAFGGLDRLRERGRFAEPSSSREAVRELEDLGSPVGAFLRDRCTITPGASVAVDTLYAAWRAWCDDGGRDRPGNVQTFGRDLRAAVPGVRVEQPRDSGGGRLRVYNGIGLSSAHNGEDRVPSRANVPNAPSQAGSEPLARDGTRTGPLRAERDQGDGQHVPDPDLERELAEREAREATGSLFDGDAL